MSILIQMRLIDRQETPTSVMEVYACPYHQKVRFLVIFGEKAHSQVWTQEGWKSVHQLLDVRLPMDQALVQLHRVTDDILGWTMEEPHV